MQISDRFANNRSRSVVPAGELVSGARLAIIIIGVTMTLPMFMLSGEVMAGLGGRLGAAAMIVAGVILASLASITGYIGAKTRLTTYAIIIAPFGEVGAKLLTVLLAFTAMGWFGVTVGFFGDAVGATVHQITGTEIPNVLYALVGGALMTATILYGFRAMDGLNRIAVPLFVIILVWSSVKLLGAISFSDLWRIEASADATIKSFGLGVSAIVGAVAALAGGMPDLTRFARSGRDAIIACALSLGSVSMVLIIVAGAPSLLTGNPDFTSNLIGLGLGLPALAMLIFATWTTSIINIYAASLALARVFRAPPDWLLTLFVGTVGTAFALVGAAQHFIGIIVVISAMIPPIAGVYVVHFFLSGATDGNDGGGPKLKPLAFLAWAIGAAVAYLTSFSDASLTTVPALDGLLSAAASYFLLKKLSKIRLSGDH